MPPRRCCRCPVWQWLKWFRRTDDGDASPMMLNYLGHFLGDADDGDTAADLSVDLDDDDDDDPHTRSDPDILVEHPSS